jgi:DNA-directed RNA polymerase specialized sigma24 family protein
MSESLEQTNACFMTTQWTVIQGLSSQIDSESRSAADKAAKMYWPPVYACARRLVQSREEATDLTQGFFADVVLGRHLFENANANKGRLRSLILTALKRYATDQWRRTSARGGGRNFSLNALDREDSLGIEGDSDCAFDRRWALSLFDEALRRCEAHFSTESKIRHWRIFEARVLQPAMRNTSVRPLAADSDACGFRSSAEGAAAVQTVKRRFAAIFREVISETITDKESLEGEYCVIRSLLADH